MNAYVWGERQPCLQGAFNKKICTGWHNKWTSWGRSKGAQGSVKKASYDYNPRGVAGFQRDDSSAGNTPQKPFHTMYHAGAAAGDGGWWGAGSR